MKVDLGQCAVCGAKNSKYVEKCYKCGAPLPWAPGYVAPKNAPQKAAPQPVVTPSATPTDAGAKTVVIPPIDDAKSTPIVEPQNTSSAPTIAERAQNKVQVPAWAMVAGGLGLLLLGMALWALLGKKPAPTVAVAPTPSTTTTALAPIVPVTTAQPTTGPTAQATAVATGAPTAQPAAIATVAPTPAAPAASVAGAPASGLNFDELYANLTTGTPQQQELYWNSVKGKKINWRGEFVSLGNAATGPLVVNCKGAKGALKVTVNLDATKPQTLPKYTLNQSVPFEGILESHSAGEVTVKNGRAG